MKTYAVSLFVLLFIFTSCKTKSSDNPLENDLSDQAVSVWENVPMYETPDPKGKWLASINLGEKVEWLDSEKEIELGNKKVMYVKIALQDGKQGWAQTDFLIENSAPAVLLNEAVLYSRPDLLTKTGKSFHYMDIVAIKKGQNGFYEIAGKRSDGKWIDRGWIQESQISFKDADIAVAKYTSKALSTKNETEKSKLLQEILDNPAFQESVFIADVSEMVYGNEGEDEGEVSIENDEVQDNVDTTTIVE